MGESVLGSAEIVVGRAGGFDIGIESGGCGVFLRWRSDQGDGGERDGLSDANFGLDFPRAGAEQMRRNIGGGLARGEDDDSRPAVLEMPQLLPLPEENRGGRLLHDPGATSRSPERLLKRAI